MGFLSWLRSFANRDNALPYPGNPGKFYYLINYDEEYKEILSNLPNRETAISELFLFRFWLTQYSYRLQRTKGVSEDLILRELIPDGLNFGKGIFELNHRIKFEKLFQCDFMKLMEDRFAKYDQGVISENNPDDPIGLVYASIVLATKLTEDTPLELDLYLIEKTNKQFTEIVALHVGDIESAKRIVRELTFVP